MNNDQDGNPLVKRETDNDSELQTSNVLIEMSNVNCFVEKEIINNGSISNSEEDILLTQTSSGDTEEKIDDSSDDAIEGGSKPFPILSASTTSSESICRICQLAGKETGEDLKTTECECRGNMSCVHQSCLRQWVYYKGSNKCEICNGRFTAISPPTTPGILQTEALQNLAWQIERTRPFNRRKRAIMAAVIVFLVIVTAVTALLTVSADREFERLSSNPWVTQDQINNSNIIFSICIAFSFFCATMTLGLIIIWFGMEMCFIIHRRGILRRATTALLNNETA